MNIRSQNSLSSQCISYFPNPLGGGVGVAMCIVRRV